MRGGCGDCHPPRHRPSSSSDQGGRPQKAVLRAFRLVFLLPSSRQLITQHGEQIEPVEPAAINAEVVLARPRVTLDTAGRMVVAEQVEPDARFQVDGELAQLVAMHDQCVSEIQLVGGVVLDDGIGPLKRVGRAQHQERIEIGPRVPAPMGRIARAVVGLVVDAHEIDSQPGRDRGGLLVVATRIDRLAALDELLADRSAWTSSGGPSLCPGWCRRR